MIDIIDNFVTEEEAGIMYHYMMSVPQVEDRYPDYGATNFNRDELWHPVLENISSRIENQYGVTLNRAWSFIYNKESNGVPLHADPAKTLTVNIWVTPEEQMNMREGYNGLTIYPVEPPNGWDPSQYNLYNRIELSRTCIENVDGIVSEYKYRRATIFNSRFFHESQRISAKTNRISWTFVFD